MLNKETLNTLEKTFGPFIIDRVWGGNNTPFLRFGYWRRVNVNQLQSIIGNEIIIEENDDWDDDCGGKYMYKMIERYKG
jgi:hypothetical protein